MSKLYKALLAMCLVGSLPFTATAQQGKYWTATDAASVTTKHKAVARQTFPKEFKTFKLNLEELQQQLFTVVDRPGQTAVISLPNAAGILELFRVVEASNFEPALQARYPQIRAFSGQGITDPSATLKLSISPQGVQTMIFRSGSATEYIDPYSQDGRTIAVFKKQRAKGGLPWVCSTQDVEVIEGINSRVTNNITESNTGELRVFRLAQSCNGEYANWHGASTTGTPADEALVLGAFNGTLTRTNGCYEKDLAIHLNLIAATTQVIFYNPVTDPYGAGIGGWNVALMNTLHNILGDAAFDIGHMFGASGGGGNAGCIGCVCNNTLAVGGGPNTAYKGSGITSPADGIPMGDNFDIDYVAHEVGHQLGGNHTFSMSNEGAGVNKEVGSGVTIMGYAGITSQDVDDHSIDIFHQTSIQQIQVNMVTRTCAVITSQAGINATPVVAALTSYTIPISTPFALTGSATDADAGDVLTYCWEQDNDGAGQTGANSVARENKPTGPNWLTVPATTSPTRLMPRLSTILAGGNITGPNPGGDAGANTEALSNVNRTLNFRLTARDNRPYNSGTGAVGQTNFQDMVVTVNNSGGPFLITSQNSAVTYDLGTTQTVTWSVGNTTAAPFNSPNVRISFSSDLGANWTVLHASTANDGSETFTVPGPLTTQGRIRVESIGNIFFDINNANITVAAPPVGYSFGTVTGGTSACPPAAPIVATLPIISNGGYVQPVTLTATAGVPAGTSITFGTNPVTPGNSTTVTLNTPGALTPGTYAVTIQGVGAAPGGTQTTTVNFVVNPGAGPSFTTQPTNQTVCAGTNATFTSAAAGATFQWQLSTNGGGTWNNIAAATSASYTVSSPTAGMNGYQYRVIASSQCGSTTSNVATLTVNEPPVASAHPTNLSLCSGSSASFTGGATGSGISYQWEFSTDGGGSWNNVPAAAPYSNTQTATLNISAVTVGMNNYRYRLRATGSCPPSAVTNPATLLVSSSVTVTSNPTSQTVCEATTTSFTVAASGSGLSYQWEVSTNGGGSWTNVPAAAPYSGTTTPTLTITGVPPTLNGYQYRAIVSSGVCTPGVSTAATLTVNTFPVITTQPANVTICENAAASFSVAATTGVGTLTYQWQLSTNGGGSWSNIAGATTNTFAQTGIPVGQNGYRFRVIVTAGCGSVTSNAAIITVNAYPVIEMNFSPTLVVCVSDPAFSIGATPAGGVFTGAGVSGTTFNPATAGVGNAVVTYTVSNAGCQSVQTRTIVVNECPERHLRLQDFPATVVYPNPNAGDFHIRMQTDLYTTIDIKLFNSLGQLVKQQVATGLSYGSVIDVDTHNLSNGTYHLYLSSGSDKKATSLIIQKY